MLIINESGAAGGCFLGSAFAGCCRLVVIRIAAYKNRNSNINNARFHSTKPFPLNLHDRTSVALQLPPYKKQPKIKLRSCCKDALFQQQPVNVATAPVLASAFAKGCNWLHNESASSSAQKLQNHIFYIEKKKQPPYSSFV
jgi:hypothetical protein